MAFTFEERLGLRMLDLGGAHVNVLHPQFAIACDGTDESVKLDNALAYAHALGMPVWIPPHPNGNPYVISSVNYRAGQVIFGYGARIVRPANTPNWTRTFTSQNHLWDSDEDSPLGGIFGLTIDGNLIDPDTGEFTNQGAYKNYEKEQAHLIFLWAATDKPGRLRVVIRDVNCITSVGDGVAIYSNCDVLLDNYTAHNCFRGGWTLTGGNSRVRVKNYTSTNAGLTDDGVNAPSVDYTGWDVEIDAPGYNNSHAVVIEIDGAEIDGDCDIGVGAGSVVNGSDITMNGPGWSLVLADSVTNFRNCLFRPGVATGVFNRIVYPGDLTFEQCEFRLSEAAATEADNAFKALHIYWYTGGDIRTGQRVRLINPKFTTDGTLETADTISAIYTQATDVVTEDNMVEIRGGSVSAEYDFALFMEQGGRFDVDDLRSRADTYIKWAGAGGYWAHLRIARPRHLGAGPYMDAAADVADNIVEHISCEVQDADNRLAGAMPFANTQLTGARIIYGAGAPTAATHAFKGDIYRLQTPAAGAIDEWRCTTGGIGAGAAWKAKSTLAA